MENMNNCIGDCKYYHGGIPNLMRGDKILPPSITGKSTLLEYAREVAPDGPQRADQVYIATDMNAAMLYASVYPYGDVYEVVPDGEVEDDPDCIKIGLSYACESATVKRIIHRHISPSLAREVFKDEVLL